MTLLEITLLIYSAVTTVLYLRADARCIRVTVIAEQAIAIAEDMRRHYTSKSKRGA
jgi:hypothetical protein